MPRPLFPQSWGRFAYEHYYQPPKPILRVIPHLLTRALGDDARLGAWCLALPLMTVLSSKQVSHIGASFSPGFTTWKCHVVRPSFGLTFLRNSRPWKFLSLSPSFFRLL
ncbi:hypothetical protein BDN70DRAFT_435124 [Pholiota conissans]|uniref:Uncharacterized protein n=1 Tax=Pholiota conissans TaxID=109636 RepID=A0A9P5YPQ2_9AGAR|nr:hypothetical protein BDN70DRAFT_435124 [Pholiota conissans]